MVDLHIFQVAWDNVLMAQGVPMTCVLLVKSSGLKENDGERFTMMDETIESIHL